MKKFIIVAISIIAVFIGAFAVYNYYSEPEVEPDQVGLGQVDSVTDKVVLLKPINQRASEKKHSAKVFYESIRKTTAPVISEVILGQVYAEKLNTALAGDLEMAAEISGLQSKCNSLKVQEKRLDTTTVVIEGSDQISEAEMDQKMQVLQNRKYDRFVKTKKQCMEAFDGDYESDLGMLARHDELYQQALAGNVMAKYIYAVQTHSEHYLTELFLLDIDFAAVALTFTNENLIERPDLGLLAYAQSYTTRGQFTPARLSVGIAYFIAAGICGVNPEIINSFSVLNLLATEETVSYLAPIEKILTLADTLSQRHCPA